MQPTEPPPAISPRIAMLVPVSGHSTTWHDALIQTLTTRYAACVQKVSTLADGQPECLYDLLLDLSCGHPAVHAPFRARRHLVALYGTFGQRLEPQLLMGQTPWIAIAEQTTEAPTTPRILADSCVALPQWSSYAQRQQLCETRLAQLVVRALDHVFHGHPLPTPNTPPRNPDVPLWLARTRFAMVSHLGKLHNVMRKPFVHIGQWRLATRVGGSGAFQPWPVEPDRFLADPFLLQWQGRVYLFCEEYSHDTGRGSIVWSCFHPAAQGWSVPRPALVRDWHLSYPFVFHGPDGAVHMLPEQNDAGVLTLYRAERFPDRWQPVADLLTGPDITDATLYRNASGWWLFCGRGWDELFLYHADDLMGPYRPHPRNPVKSDARSARPGGRLFRDETGALIRPAQDCSQGYGCAVALCRIEDLGPASYSETMITRLSPGLIPGSCGVHSYDRLQDIEVVDGKTSIQRRHWNFAPFVARFMRRPQEDIQIAR